MTEREQDRLRLIAWNRELRSVHERLREALRVTRAGLNVSPGSGMSADPVAPAPRDLLLFCYGFCTALTGHHEGEDSVLFPAIADAHPELRDTLLKLQQDHSMIAHLLAGLQAATARTASPAELERHLEGIAAIMESHFRYEERSLLQVLDVLALDAGVSEALGPL